MRILAPPSKIPKLRIPLMELMLKYGSSKMVSCSTGRRPVHVKLGRPFQNLAKYTSMKAAWWSRKLFVPLQNPIKVQ